MGRISSCKKVNTRNIENTWEVGGALGNKFHCLVLQNYFVMLSQYPIITDVGSRLSPLANDTILYSAIEFLLIFPSLKRPVIQKTESTKQKQESPECRRSGDVEIYDEL